MQNKFRQYISSLLAIVILITSISLPAFAEVNNGTGGTQIGADDGTWNTPNQGYRISIIKNDGTFLTGKDILFSSIDATSMLIFTKNKLGNGNITEANRKDVSQPMLEAGIPRPFTIEGGNLIGHGEDLKEWLVTGEFYGYAEPDPPSGGGGGAGSSGGLHFFIEMKLFLFCLTRAYPLIQECKPC